MTVQPSKRTLEFGSGLSGNLDPVRAAEQVCQNAERDLGSGPVDFAVLFCANPHIQHATRIVEIIRARLDPTILIGASAGALIGGGLAVRIRPRWTLAISMLGQAVGVLLLLRADSMFDGLVYATWNGLFFGAAVTMVQVIYPDYFGRRELGLIRGAFQPISLTFNAAGPLVAGLWFDGTGTYTGSFLLIFCFLIAGAVALALAPYPVRTSGGESANPDREAG